MSDEEAPSGRWVSPNDMLQAAKEHMLEGRDPASNEEWTKVVNFVAFNVGAGTEQSICELFRMIFDIPLDEESVREIAEYQEQLKGDAKD